MSTLRVEDWVGVGWNGGHDGALELISGKSTLAGLGVGSGCNATDAREFAQPMGVHAMIQHLPLYLRLTLRSAE